MTRLQTLALKYERQVGVLLFLPVPVVLWLFTQQQLGVARSLAYGVIVMVTHRLYARPWALARAGRRCLWCAGPADGSHPLALVEPVGSSTWQACGPLHLENLRRVLGWAHAHALLLKVGILGALIVFLPAAWQAGFGKLGAVQTADCVAFFRTAIALSVLPMGVFALFRPPSPADPLPVPFPVHIQALIGTSSVLWLFRIVGLTWLVLALWHVVVRLALV